MRKAENLDPLSLVINADLAELLALAHAYDESIQQSRKTIEMDPNFGLAHNHLGQAYLQKHMNDDAIAELRGRQAVGRQRDVHGESRARVRRLRQTEAASQSESN